MNSGQVVDSYPLSPMQLGMLYHWLRDPGAGVDIEQVSCTIRSVDIPTFLRAWEEIARRHAALRTVFRWRDVDAPVQDVVSAVALHVREEDWRTRSDQERQRAFATFIEADRRRGFDFAVPPLFRLTFFRTSDDQYEFVWTFPHALLDGRSFVLVLRDVIDALHRLEQGGDSAAAPAPRPYRDYIDWLGRQDPGPARQFWSRALSGFAEPVFPELGPIRADSSAPVYDEQGLHLTRGQTEALKAFVARHALTLNTLVQGAWALLLHRYTGADDVVFGATRAGRRSVLAGDPSVGEMVGLFINTLPVRVRIAPDRPLVDWLEEIRRDQVAVRVAEHALLTDVQTAGALPPGAPLFETMLVYEHQQQATSYDAMDPRLSGFRLREQTTFPLTLHAYGEAELFLRIEYYRDRFTDASIARMLGHLATLLNDMVAKEDQPISALAMVAAAERHQLVTEWNDTARVYPEGNSTLSELMANRAAASPTAVALVRDGASMTYGELDARAATLARALGGYGVGPGVLVGVCMERSFELIVAVVAILKAGGAYVPLDPDYPSERLAFMLADSGCPVLLTQRHIAVEKLDGLASAATLLHVDTEWERIVAEAAAAKPVTPAGADDLVYMIYTSGSTGKPKGAMNRHRGVVNLLLWMQSEYRLTPDDAVLQKTPSSFDWSVPELFLPLIAGARLVVADPGGHRDPAYLTRMMRDYRVTILYIVPSMLRALLEGDSASMPASLRNVSCSGEALPYDIQERFLARHAGARMYNLYGPTECAVEATCWLCRPGDPSGMVPIGRPLANTAIYILDAAMEPVPIGVPGELYIGGIQVGAGYHRRPELTAERYVPDSFSERPAARLYRTGDRARWLEDGTLEYLGRLDFQIKLRGFRIEVGEIEAALASDPAVRECAVVLRTDAGIEPRLVAYYVPAAGSSPSAAQLREPLERTLPTYMVPWTYVPLPALPLSPSGKLDRRALPAPEETTSTRELVAPRNPVEARLLDIWKEVIGAKSIGVTDRFNEVGGNSLAAVRVFSRIAKEFAQELQLVTILKHDTVEQLAAVLQAPQPAAWSCIVPFTTTAPGVPIFCPHAQTGNVLIYQHFAKEVAQHHPVYGIQAYGNWGDQQPHESVEEMVDFYVAEILTVRPKGPYIFLGGSLGGLLALELAHAMRALGHEVQLLVMYDTVGPGYPRYRLLGGIANFVRHHGGIPLWRLQQIFAADRSGGRSLRKMAWRAREAMRWWYHNTRRDYLYWKYEKRNPPLDFPMPTNLTRVRLASRRVMAGYQPRYYSGKITYFRAESQPTGAIHDPMNGWSGRSAEFEVHPLPSGHTDGMSYPIVVQLARTFLDCVQALDSGNCRHPETGSVKDER